MFGSLCPDSFYTPNWMSVLFEAYVVGCVTFAFPTGFCGPRKQPQHARSLICDLWRLMLRLPRQHVVSLNAGPVLLFFAKTDNKGFYLSCSPRVRANAKFMAGLSLEMRRLPNSLSRRVVASRSRLGR